MDEVDHRGDNAKTELRDEHGHFIHSAADSASAAAVPGAAPSVPPPPVAPAPAPSQASTHPLVDDLIPHTVSIDHKVDDNTLLDVHLGNPLRRIQALLEDIKSQKAFSFTLKGSLGIAGIALVITTFGIFGGTQAFCSKGTQSEIGTLKVLDVAVPHAVPFIPSQVVSAWEALTGQEDTKTHQRLVLIKQDQSVLQVIRSQAVALSEADYASPVIVTGDYDSCSQTLSLKDAHAVQSYP